MRYRRVLVGVLAIFVAWVASPGTAADLPAARPRAMSEPAPVLAPDTGFYFATRAAITKPDVTSFASANTGRVDTDYELGSLSTGALGYRFAPLTGLGARVEVEGGFGRFSVDRHHVGGVRQDKIDSYGTLQAVTGFVSGYVDFDAGWAFGSTGPLSALRPFIGGGVGAANVTLRKQGTSTAGVLIDDSDTRLAYHASAGLGLALSQLGLAPTTWMRNATFEVGYRFLQVPDLSFSARDGTIQTTSLTANMVTVGFRRSFGSR